MIYCFDLDGTLCETNDGDYLNAVPLLRRVARVNRLYDAGHTIIIDSARGSVTGEDWHSQTLAQLEEWGVKHHQLYVGRKPYADVYVDDRGHDPAEILGVET